MGKRKRAKQKQDEEEGEQQPMDAPSSSSSSSSSLYQVLGLESSASQKEIKKAYYKLALRLHPYKNPGDEEAEEKFQQLQKVMSILGDEDKQALYNQTGCIDDDVTVAGIEEFEANYRGSDSEKKYLIDLYGKYKGDMNRLFCSMLCSGPKLDSPLQGHS